MARCITLEPDEWDRLSVDADARKEAIERMRRLLDSISHTLTPKQRQVVEMHYWQGLSEREIADELHLSHQGVHERLALAKKKMRSQSKNYLPDTCQ